jgi:peptidoglycan/xylan/chitin deacetylase (PgdA/CDA1 family)
VSRVGILVYHGIGVSTGYKVRTVKELGADLDAIRSAGFKVISYAELLTGPVDSDSVILNFDDGLQSQLRAVPLLEERRMKATFCISTCPHLAPPATDAYMTPEQVRELGRRYEIAGHSHRHINALYLTKNQIMEDIRLMLATFWDWFVIPSRVFILPQGANTPAAEAAAREMKLLALRTTRAGLIYPDTDLMNLPAFEESAALLEAFAS